MAQPLQSSSSSAKKAPKAPKLPAVKELSPRQEEELVVKNAIPAPVPEKEINHQAVRVNGYEGVVEQVVTVDTDYNIRKNDRYIKAGLGGSTMYLPAINPGHPITIKNTGGTPVNVDGNGMTIDGSATTTISTPYGFKTFVIISGEWNEV